MNKDEKTLREIFLEKQKVQKKRRIIFIILGGAILIGIGILSISYREELIANYHSVKGFLTQNISEQEVALKRGETASEKKVIKDDDYDLDLYNEWKDSRESTDSGEVYWEYEGESYDNNSEILYEKEFDDESYYEKNQRLMEELWGDDEWYDYEGSDDNTWSYDPTYEEPEFDMDTCMGECEEISAQYYDQCMAAYESYLQGAQEAYERSLNNCISDLGRYDPVCEENAQELYDSYLSSPTVQTYGPSYCEEQTVKSYNSCYQDHCIDNPLNN
jgi:hypothetical protein